MSVQLFSFEEVSKHNNKDDLWMIIDGKVYDITKFQDEVRKDSPNVTSFFLNTLQISTLVVNKS